MSRKKDLPVLPYLDGPLSHPFYSKVVKRAIDLLLALVLLIPAGIIDRWLPWLLGKEGRKYP